jgi:hypothetical protein
MCHARTIATFAGGSSEVVHALLNGVEGYLLTCPISSKVYDEGSDTLHVTFADQSVLVVERQEVVILE